MSKENNIDDLFRDGLGNSSYEFNPDNWKEMESALNSRDRISWLKKIALATVVITVAAAGIYQFSSQPENQVLLAQNNTEKESTFASQNPNLFESTSKNTENSQKVTTSPNQPVEHSNDLTLNGRTKNAPKAILSPTQNNTQPSLPPTKKNIVFQDEQTIIKNFVPPNPDVKNELNAPQIESINSRTFDWKKIDKKSALFKENYALESFQFSMTDPVDGHLLKYKRNYLSAMGAINLGNNLGGKGVFSLSLLHAIGLKYGIQLTNTMAIEAGVNYRNRSGKGATLVFENVEYGFGKTVTTTEIKAKSLHYIELPLDIKFSFAQKHNVYGGASLSYLLNVRSEKNTNTDESLKSNQQQSEVLWGHQHGFTSVDVGLRLGYDYEITNNLNVGLMGTYGLVDITDNKSFQNNTSDNNVELRFRVQYKLVHF